jgi:hypothetical protein
MATQFGRFYINNVTDERLIASASSAVGSIQGIAPAPYNRGQFPLVGASTIQLDLNIAGKIATNVAPPWFARAGRTCS